MQRGNAQCFQLIGIFQRQFGFELHILAGQILQFGTNLSFRHLQYFGQLAELRIADGVPVDGVALAFGRINRSWIECGNFQVTAHGQYRAVPIHNSTAQRRLANRADQTRLAAGTQFLMVFFLHEKTVTDQTHKNRADCTKQCGQAVIAFEGRLDFFLFFIRHIRLVFIANQHNDYYLNI